MTKKSEQEGLDMLKDLITAGITLPFFLGILFGPLVICIMLIL